MKRDPNLIKRINERRVEDDEEEKEDEFVKTPSNYTPTDDEDETNVESKVKNKAKGDEEKGMDYTINQFDDDVDIWLNEPVNVDEGFIQKEVPVLVITKSLPIYTTLTPQSLPSFTPPPPKSTPTPPPTTKTTNPLSVLPDFAYVFQFNNRVSTLEKEVAELKKDDLLNTQMTTLVDEHLDSRLGATRDEFMSYLSASITARIT
ncbi:hypothetical protein Tco_0067420 [Tanacetum coccineum]